MAKKNEKQDKRQKDTSPGSTTSLGKRRSLGKQRQGQKRAASPRQQQQSQARRQQASGVKSQADKQSDIQGSTMSNPRSEEYGSQASPIRIPTTPKELTKVAILGAAGGIGQPLAMLLMLHSEYVHNLALHDLADSVRGVGIDLSHIDRQCKVTSHLGPDELADAVRGARVVLVPAGLAQKPGMSRDDLFGSNAKIMYNLARVCAQVAPEAMLAIITNPVNSLVPLVCEVYKSVVKGNDSFRRIFGVTTLDVVRASSLLAKSAFYKAEPNGLFKDPSKLQVPVVGGHAGKTILPLLSQATPRLDKQRLAEDKATTMTLVDSIQEAGIDVLNGKKGRGSATLAMAYAACRFTISLLRAQLGESNIVECAYVRHATPIYSDLDYFAAPLVLGRDGYARSHGVGKVSQMEEQMLAEAVHELRLSIAKGEDFAREQLSAESATARTNNNNNNNTGNAAAEAAKSGGTTAPSEATNPADNTS